MAKSRSADAVYEALAALRGQPATPQAIAQISQALQNKSNVVVARAAELASQLKLTDLCSDLTEAFDRFCRDSKFPDGACIARTAVARAALELHCPAESLFLAGIHQLDRDAAELRAICALGLVQVRYRGVMNELVELLVDPIPTAQIGAVRAIANTGREDAAAVLRLKVLVGDRDADVIAECFAAMIQLDASGALPFVERYLDDEQQAVRDGAALAIGASRHPTAASVLCGRFHGAMDRDFRPTLLLAISTCRTAEAMDFLIDLIRDKPPQIGAEAIEALALYRHDANLRRRLEEAIQHCDSEILKREYGRRFGTNP
jgi:hypothetical protein